MADPDRDDPGENDTRPGMCGHVQTLQPDGTWRDPIGRRYAPPPGYKKVAQVAYEARVAQEEAEVAQEDDDTPSTGPADALASAAAAAASAAAVAAAAGDDSYVAALAKRKSRKSKPATYRAAPWPDHLAPGKASCLRHPGSCMLPATLAASADQPAAQPLLHPGRTQMATAHARKRARIGGGVSQQPESSDAPSSS